MRPALALIASLLVCGGWGIAPPAAAQEGAAEFEGLPEGFGREAAYFTCRACHSLKQFTEQRMERGDWDAAIARMVDENGMAEPEPWARTTILAYLSTHFGMGTEDFEGLPEGLGREDVYYTCTACHSIRTVTQQKLDRDIWEETLDWMVEEQGMPELDPADRTLILDYLATYLAP